MDGNLEIEVIKLIDQGEYPNASILVSTLSEFNNLYYNGVIAFPNSDTSFGIDQLKKAIAISDISDDGREKKGLAILHLSLLYQVKNDFESSKREILNYKAIQSTPNPEEEALFLLTEGAQLMSEGKFEEAKHNYLKSSELFHALQKLTYQSFCLMYLAISSTPVDKVNYLIKARELTNKLEILEDLLI